MKSFLSFPVLPALVLPTLILGAATPVHAAILPGLIGPWKQISAKPVEVTKDRALWMLLPLTSNER